MKTFLVTVAVIFSFNASAFAEDLHYGFPCGIGIDLNIQSATTLAAGNLSKTIEDYKAKLSKQDYEVVSVSAPALSWDKANYTSSLCTTVTFKAKESKKEVTASSLPGTGVR